MAESEKRKEFTLEEFEGQKLATKCKIHLPNNLSEKDILSFPAFKQWLTRLLKNLDLQNNPAHTFHSNPYKLKEIDVQAADWFPGPRLGFVKLQAKVQTGEKTDSSDPNNKERREWLPGAVFLRGGSVGILFIVHPHDPQNPSATHEPFAVLTVQPRIAAASLAFAEIPAGMLDGAGDFTGKAAAEIQEEVGIKITHDDLFDMSAAATSSVPAHPWTKLDDLNLPSEDLENAMYPSAGGCDEFMPLLLCRQWMAVDEIEKLKGKATGLRDEGEKITLKVVPLRDLWKEGGRDAKALAALALFRGLEEEGRLPEMPEKPST